LDQDSRTRWVEHDDTIQRVDGGDDQGGEGVEFAQSNAVGRGDLARKTIDRAPPRDRGLIWRDARPRVMSSVGHSMAGAVPSYLQ